MNAGAGPSCYLNGAYLPLAEAKVSVLDRGFIFGDAVYEVIPADHGQLFALDEHLARLARSLAETLIPEPMNAAEWRACLTRLVALNPAPSVAVYVQVTRGVAERDHAIPVGLEPTVFAMCRALERRAGLSRVSAVTATDNRWGRCDIKSTSLLANILLRNQALAGGAYEALLLRQGYLTEGAASNVFVVAGGEVLTPPLSPHILAGVTRKVLLEVLAANAIPHAERMISEAELRAADEIWITSSTRDVLCVNELDQRPLGDGRTYPLAERVLQAFRARREAGVSGAQADAAS